MALISARGVPPGGNLLVVQLGRAVQGLGEIRQDDPGNPEIRQDFLQVADIRRGDETRQEIDRLGGLAALGQLLHHRLDRGVKTFHVGAGVAGGGDRDDLRQRRLPCQLLAELPDQIRARRRRWSR